MIEYVFEKAQEIPTDKYDKKRNYVNVIGFDSAKFDFVLLLPYLQSDDWEIDANSFIGTPSLCKQVIIKHKKYEKKLRFLD
jgi:flagellar assembly factor FliW